MSALVAASIVGKLLKATGATDWAARKFGEKVGGNAADTMIDLAMSVTGASTANTALKAINKDPALALALKKALIENEKEITLAAFDDIKDARDSYPEMNKLVDRTVDHVLLWNPIFMALIFACNCVVVMYVTDPSKMLAIGNMLGLILGQFMKERQMTFSYTLGSTIGSKMKTLFAKKN